MSSCILHLQTPLDCLKESYPSTRLVSEVPLCIPFTNAVINVHPPSSKYFVNMDVTFCEDRLYFPISHLQGESRNLKNEVESSTSQPPAPVQDSEPPRDQEKNSGDETEVRIEISNNEAEQGHTGKLDEYDLSLDILIALRKECPEWKNVIMEEMKALEKNRTWEICALPT
ncbi:reverse transcriptase [Cucumis melo var. makuwa]|uniref:Reverse transcriptase n=1 Tax=Cucumis melo var. makuwa TaxID=1194695 RepID=A0A5A7V8L5_CUCMM|nr:reverse transcriptase [Cucumis melo var. makuwa]